MIQQFIIISHRVVPIEKGKKPTGVRVRPGTLSVVDPFTESLANSRAPQTVPAAKPGDGLVPAERESVIRLVLTRQNSKNGGGTPPLALTCAA